MSRLQKTAIQTILFLMLGWVSASSQATGIDIQIALKDAAIVPGAPIIGKISVGHKAEHAIAYAIEYWFVHCRVLDGTGEVVQVYEHPDWRNEQSALYALRFPLAFAEENPSKEHVISYWCSSQMSPGQYTIVFEIGRISSWNGPPRTAKPQGVKFSPPKRIEVPMTVKEPDTDALHGIYASWLKRIEKMLSEQERDGEAMRTAVEAILYARHPIALEYQIALLKRYWRISFDFWENGYVCWPWGSIWRDSIMEAYAIDIGRYFIGTKDVEVAEALVQLAEDIAGDEDSFFYRNPRYLNWMIYGLHDSGDPEVVEATSNYVTKHPRLLAPQMYQFLD